MVVMVKLSVKCTLKYYKISAQIDKEYVHFQVKLNENGLEKKKKQNQ